MLGLTNILGGAPRFARRGSANVARPGVGLASGLVADTPVATARGWQAVEEIGIGDRVLTFDRGMQEVRQVTRGTIWDKHEECPPALWPLRVPAGALGNQVPMELLPEQGAMLESDSADVLFGNPFVVIAGCDLENFREIERRPSGSGTPVFQVHFEAPELIYVSHGALVFCSSVPVIGLDALLSDRQVSQDYRHLTASEAALLVTCLREEDAAAAKLAAAPQADYAAACA